MNTKPHCLHPALAVARSLILALLLVPVASVTAPAQEYNLIDLGRNVSPLDINDAGVIVGSMNTDQYPTTAFIRDPADGVNREIGGGTPGTLATAANAINDTGLVAGNTLTGAFLAEGSTILQDWDDHGAWGINGNGYLAGNRAGTNPYRTTSIPYDPAIYEGNGWTVMGIANVYSRGTRQGVYADIYRLLDINDNGLGVGSKHRYGLSGSSAILIAPPYSDVKDAGDVTYLPTPYGGSAAAINNQNMIAGTTGNNSGTATFAHAFLYDYNADTLVDLGTLLNADGEYGLRSSAADVNDRNQVVGSSWLVSVNTSLYDPAQYHAFLWVDGLMRDLNELIDPAAGWILTAAVAINENGAIVGTGILNGEPHGFLLTATQPPSPAPAGENQPPQAVAVADVTRGKAPLTVTFSAADSSDPEGTALSYAWDFGDGNSAFTVDPVHEYREPGIYLVFLTVTDEAGAGRSDTAQLEIRVRRGNGKK
jgi:probable HAF family extracellular repeat protein